MASTLGNNGSSWAWRKLRAQILKRDGNRCAYCGHFPANTVDHVIPRQAWPEGVPGVDSPDNLVTACKPCNSRKGAKVNTRPRSPLKRESSKWN